MADLLEELGSVPPSRVRMYPPPGLATERDVNARPDGVKRLCELVDGTLVEKPMGFVEARIAGLIIHFIECFLESHDLGIVVGPDGTVRIAPGLVRVPDVSFISWRNFPGRQLPTDAVPDLAPDLAVEVLSDSNTRQEMDRKLREYFEAGVRLVWIVDPRTRSAAVYHPTGAPLQLNYNDSLDGEDVLPGFTLHLKKLFDRAGFAASS
ncbi:MAG: Uma2 family endonuclease [Tepidisphaerales bacterium]